jgi:alpha-amylase/alpha-mannosidase (GH57 family)
MIHHATVLNLHQPWGNIDALADADLTRHQPKEILEAYDRIPRSVQGYEDVARVHLAFSGTLLEALADPGFQSRWYGIVKCGDLLWSLRNPAIDLLGTGYYHPLLPLIPDRDRGEQIRRWQGVAGHLFDRGAQGFWPPEMGFSMEMIPVLVEHGYRYVVVDAEKISPIDPMSWEEIRFRPHVARYGDHEIIVIPREQHLSIAQEAGTSIDWFINEAKERTKHCNFEPLICTASDGDNGGWFRNWNPSANFWGSFYQPLCEHARSDEAVVRPTFIHDYLDQHGAHGSVIVKTGAWETGEHHGTGFVQWTGSQSQKDAMERIEGVSARVETARQALGDNDSRYASVHEAWWRVLRAETSCHFFWGEAWVHRCHDDLTDAENILNRLV